MARLYGRRKVVTDLAEPLLAGRTVLLNGPMGSGKSALLEALARRMKKQRRPCGISRSTRSLSDITEALLSAYPAVPGEGRTRRQMRKCEQEIDYSVEVERTFAKFKQGAVKSYLSKLSAAAGMNHIEAAILDRVAQLYPDLFLRLSQYNEKYKDFVDENIAVFNREIQFYVAFAPHVLPCFRLC
jgi:energy-coupling factor transporter ATP-binding protein EcfA2